MNAVGMNTAESTRAMPTTGAEISSIAFRVASVEHPFFDVMLHRLDHHDGIVHNEADGQHEAKQRQRVDGEPEHRKDDERPDEETGTARSGIRVARQLCRKMYDEDHENDGDHQRLDDLLDPLRHGARRVQSNRVVDAARQPLPLLGEEGLHAFGGLHGIRAGRLIHGNDGARPPVQPADDGVVLCAELDTRDP